MIDANRRYGIVTLVTVMLAFYSEGCEPNYCLNRDSNPYLMGGAITSYDIVKGNATPVNSTSHKQMMIWALIRHGSRYPSLDEIVRMQLATDIQSKLINLTETDRNSIHLCEEDLEDLKNWSWNASIFDLADQMTESGLTEMTQLGERYLNIFPILSNDTTNVTEKYSFENTIMPRTVQSMKAFIRGLFGIDLNPNSITNNDALLPVFNCIGWVINTQISKKNYYFQLFENSSMFKQMVTSISEKLGMELSTNEVYAMYDNCRYERTMYPKKTSPWCAVFNTHHMMIMEYNFDISNFYTTGPGFKRNEKLGCKPVKYLMEKLSEAIESAPSNRKSHFLFSHDLTIDMMLANLRLFTDSEKLVPDNYDLLINRRYRSSLHTPFASNLVAVLYKVDYKNHDGKYAVQFFLNEKPLILRGCDSKGLCSWKYLKKILASNCDESACDP